MTYYVVAGPMLTVRIWAQARGIAFHSVLPLTRAFDANAVRGLPGADVVVVRLAPCCEQVEQALHLLTAMGARQYGPDWWPAGYSPDPTLDLRGTQAFPRRTVG